MMSPSPHNMVQLEQIPTTSTKHSCETKDFDKHPGKASKNVPEVSESMVHLVDPAQREGKGLKDLSILKVLLIGIFIGLSTLATITTFLGLVFDFSVVGIGGVHLKDARYAVGLNPTLLLLPVTILALIAVASWPTVVDLTTWPHAAHMLQEANKSSYERPSGEEGKLLVGMLNGSLMSFGRSTCYYVRFRGKKIHPQVKAAMLFVILILGNAFMILVGVLSLHGTTTLAELQGAVKGIHVANMWGRGLVSECHQSRASTNQSSNPWNFQSCPSRLLIVNQTAKAIEVLQNTSRVDRVGFIDNTALLLDPKPPSNASFMATTFGATTACTSIGINCYLNANDATFLCPTRSFSGSLDDGQVTVAPFNDTAVQAQDTLAFLAAFNLVGPLGEFDFLANDASVSVAQNQSSLVAVLECSAQIESWKYVQNIGFVHKVSSSPPEPGTAALVLSAMLPGLVGDWKGFQEFGIDLTTAASSAQSLQEIVNAFAGSFSRATMASANGIMNAIPVDAELTTYFVSAVSIPLVWFTAFFAFLYVIVTITAAVVALNAHQKPEVPRVQKYLTADGLGQMAFEVGI